MIQSIVKFLRRGAKFALALGVLLFMLSFFGQELIFSLYHLNLSMYFFFGAFLSNGTITLITTGIMFMIFFGVYKIIKKAI